MANHTIQQTEEWRPVDGWPYEVSSLGRVRRSAAACGTRVGKILKPAISCGRYLSVALFLKQVQRRVQIHTLVCEAFHGPRPTPKHCVAHNDGNGFNNTSRNLRWDTAKGNAADRAIHGTENRGERNGQSKLTAEDVLQIRALKNQGLTREYIAQKFGIHPCYVNNIVRGDVWAHTLKD